MSSFRTVRTRIEELAEAVNAAEAEATRVLPVAGPADFAAAYRRLNSLLGRGALEMSVGNRYDDDPDVGYAWRFGDYKSNNDLRANTLPELLHLAEEHVRPTPKPDTLETLEQAAAVAVPAPPF